MSYVVHIWEQPSPATWAEADALQARLDGRVAPPNPKSSCSSRWACSMPFRTAVALTLD